MANTIEEADTIELEERLAALEDYETLRQSNWGQAKFPIHDEANGDDPDSDWNSTWKIEVELGRRYTS